MNTAPANKNNVVNPKGIRRQSIPYIWTWVLYYAWVIAFTVWWTAVPYSEAVFTLEYREIIHAVNMLSSVICVFTFRKENFAASARIGAAASLVMLVVFLAAPFRALKTAAAVMLGAALGSVNISILFPFVFIMNNTEKLTALVLGHAFGNIFPLLPAVFGTESEGYFVAGLFALTLLAAPFLKAEHLGGEIQDNLTNNTKIRPAMILTLIASTCGAILFLGAGKAILNIHAAQPGIGILLWYFLGGIAGSLLYAIIFALPQLVAYLALSLPFGCLSAGLLCNAFADRVPGMATAFALLLGIGTTMGMSTVYYVLGVAGKKYGSTLYLRLSILFIGIFGGVSGVFIGDLVDHAVNVQPVSIAFTFVSATAVILVLVFSSSIARICFDDTWAGDIVLIEVTDLQQAAAVVEASDTLEQLHLTPREKEVCALLLKGFSVRQVSGELGLAFATVNGYYRSLYKKLGINSRAELFMRLGAQPAALPAPGTSAAE